MLHVFKLISCVLVDEVMMSLFLKRRLINWSLHVVIACDLIVVVRNVVEHKSFSVNNTLIRLTLLAWGLIRNLIVHQIYVLIVEAWLFIGLVSCF
jgi:hypothetical protein